jgi:hypothetical protein
VNVAGPRFIVVSTVCGEKKVSLVVGSLRSTALLRWAVALLPRQVWSDGNSPPLTLGEQLTIIRWSWEDENELP